MQDQVLFIVVISVLLVGAGAVTFFRYKKREKIAVESKKASSSKAVSKESKETIREENIKEESSSLDLVASQEPDSFIPKKEESSFEKKPEKELVSASVATEKEEENLNPLSKTAATGLDTKKAEDFVSEEGAAESRRLEDESSVKEETPKNLSVAMEKTRKGFFGRIKNLFSGQKSLAPDDLDELEEILYTSDLGPQTVQRLMDGINDRLKGKEKSDFEAVRAALRVEMESIFSEIDTVDPFEHWNGLKNEGPVVIMVVGVNGAGKTTTIGKLTQKFVDEGKKVLIAAGDTFRAAAQDQLRVWTERAGVEIFAPEGVTDPSAVSFDAVKKAQAKGMDVLIVDTAGRLHTQSNLMEELKKMKRVMGKNLSSAPDEVLLVLDANSGQNALIQAKQFHEALGVTGVVITKLDGTAKGGVALGVACELHIPIRLIGVGEGVQDLRSFSGQEFVESII